jgi:hypothetical protein
MVDILDEGKEIVIKLRNMKIRKKKCYSDGKNVEKVNI